MTAFNETAFQSVIAPCDEENDNEAWKEREMSEQIRLTAEEARDLSNRLDSLARELSPGQREYLGKLLTAGAASSEVQGYMDFGAAPVAGGMVAEGTLYLTHCANCIPSIAESPFPGVVIRGLCPSIRGLRASPFHWFKSPRLILALGI